MAASPLARRAPAAILAAALATSLVAPCASADPASSEAANVEPAAAKTLTGTIKVVCTIVTDASLPAGSEISVSVEARGAGVGASQSVEAATTLKKTSNSQRVVLSLPYSWVLDGPQPKAPIFFQASAGVYPAYSSAGLNLTIPLPASGATTTISIPARL